MSFESFESWFNKLSRVSASMICSRRLWYRMYSNSVYVCVDCGAKELVSDFSPSALHKLWKFDNGWQPGTFLASSLGQCVDQQPASYSRLLAILEMPESRRWLLAEVTSRRMVSQCGATLPYCLPHPCCFLAVFSSVLIN